MAILLLKIAVGIIFLLIVGIVAFFVYRHSRTQTGENQKIFLSGKVPNQLPNGLYNGSVPGRTFSWKGKKFDREKKTGINVFEESGKRTENYPFKLYTGKGAVDKDLDVIKIDYNISGNPLWLRFILDEIVEVEKDKYLGKLHIRFLGLSFALGYFNLEKSN